MIPVLCALAVLAVVRRHRRASGYRLLTFEGDYSLSIIRQRGLEKVVTSSDLGGFFEHVWRVHPAVGASPEEPPGTVFGGPATTAFSPRHTIIEGRVGYSDRLARLPFLNAALAQSLLLLRLDRLIAREGICLIRVSDPFYLAGLGLVLARCHRIPLVIRLIGNYDGEYYKAGRAAYPRLLRKRWVEKRIDRFVLPRAQLVAASTQDILGYAVANGANPDRCTTFLIGNLIDPVHFLDEAPDRSDIRSELGIGERPFVMYVGRLTPGKHPEDVLQAFVKARTEIPELAAVFVGDGVMRARLESDAKKQSVGEDVIFVGNRDQAWVADALASATVILSPVTGRALVEAMLSGTPVVAYDVDWQAELVHDGTTGLLIPYRDTDKMAEAACRLIQDPEQALALGAQGRANTLRVMDPDTLIRHERGEYENLLRGG
jgi:glycosyltransferase involved in cell wall biosynthesis